MDEYHRLHRVMFDLVYKMSSRQQRLFACDCAEYVLPIFENHYPGEDRPRKLIEAMRQSANHKTSEDEIDQLISIVESVETECEIQSAKFAVGAALHANFPDLYAVTETNTVAISAVFASAREKGILEPIDELVEFKKWQAQRAQAILDGLYDQE